MLNIRTGASEMSEPIIQSFFHDFRYGVRILRKSPGFSAIAILSLALGIMAATAMYSVIYGVVLNPFPYRDVDSLMSVKIWSPDQSGYRVGYTVEDRKSTRLNSSHQIISYAVFCLKKKNK